MHGGGPDDTVVATGFVGAFRRPYYKIERVVIFS